MHELRKYVRSATSSVYYIKKFSLGYPKFIFPK